MKKKLIKASLNVLITLGSILVISVGAYEAINYPWRASFGNAPESPQELPEPAFPEARNPETVIIPYDKEKLTQVAEQEIISAGENIFSGTQTSGTYMVLGTLKIPKINMSSNLLEGTGTTQLNLGAAHLTGTAMPGEAGNCAVAGHRLVISMHPFRYVDKLEENDRIYIEFDGASYVYEMYESLVVAPEDVWVLENVPGEEAVLTLITCEPVYNPVNRLIIRARLVS